MNTLRAKLQAMFRETDGGVAIMTGLLMTLTVPSVIAAVDLTSISKTRAQVQSHLDGALLAATRFDDLSEANDSGKLEDRGRRFLFNSLKAADIDASNAETSFEYDKDANVMRGRVEINAPTIFAGKVLDIDRLTLTSEVVPKERIELEIALSLDVSGSMAWAIDSDTPAEVGSRRIDALREGVQSLATVFDGNHLVNARISVVPYSSSVNVSATSEATASTDPAQPVWVAERVERSGNGKYKISKKPPQSGQKVPLKNVGTPASSVLALSNTQVAVAHMDNVEPDGGTAGHIGAEWALYSLLPEWSSVWNHPGKKAAELNSSARKVLVMMTDGDFTVTQTEGVNIEDAYEIFQNVCETARDEGVTIYTVGLKASENTDEQLTECAGSKDRYYPVDNRTAITEAFEEIAAKATRVRVSK